MVAASYVEMNWIKKKTIIKHVTWQITIRTTQELVITSAELDARISVQKTHLIPKNLRTGVGLAKRCKTSNENFLRNKVYPLNRGC